MKNKKIYIDKAALDKAISDLRSDVMEQITAALSDKANKAAEPLQMHFTVNSERIRAVAEEARAMLARENTDARQKAIAKQRQQWREESGFVLGEKVFIAAGQFQGHEGRFMDVSPSGPSHYIIKLDSQGGRYRIDAAHVEHRLDVETEQDRREREYELNQLRTRNSNLRTRIKNTRRLITQHPAFKNFLDAEEKALLLDALDGRE